MTRAVGFGKGAARGKAAFSAEGLGALWGDCGEGRLQVGWGGCSVGWMLWRMVSDGGEMAGGGGDDGGGWMGEPG